MIDDLKLKKFLVVHSDGTRDITEAVNDEFLEIRYEEIDEKIESIEEIKIQKIKIVKYGSILYEIKREYTDSEFNEVVEKILNNIRNIAFDKKSHSFICEKKITGELACFLFNSNTL